MADFTSRFNELLTRNPGSNTDLAQALGVSKQAISTWKIGTSTPKPPTIRTIAEYFGVDVDWLNGETDTESAYSRNDVFSSYDPKRVDALLKDRNMSPGEFAEAIGLSLHALELVGHLRGVPSTPLLYKMADVLGCSVDYLLGLTDEVNPIALQRLSSVELDLVSIYRDLNSRGQQSLMDVARGLAAIPDNRKDGASNNVTA